MNGKKVLNQLIKLFAVINIVLFIVNYAFRGNQYVLSEERIDNITKLLKQDGISVESEIVRNYAPKYSASLNFMGDSVSVRDKIINNFFGEHLVSVKRSTAVSKNKQNGSILYYHLGDETLAFDHNELSYTNKSIRTYTKRPNLEQARNTCMKLIKRIDEEKSRMTYKMVPKQYDNYWKIIYFPVIEGIAVMDSYMMFEVYSDGIANASLKLAQIELKSDSRQDIYAADLVLFGVADDMIEKGYTTVEEIELCYKCAENEENVLGQQIIPMYKIQITGLEDPIFVNAYTNEMLE